MKPIRFGTSRNKNVGALIKGLLSIKAINVLIVWDIGPNQQKLALIVLKDLL